MTKLLDDSISKWIVFLYLMDYMFFNLKED